MDAAIIVEGKHDRERLLPMVNGHTRIFCTFGIPTHGLLMQLRAQAANVQVYIFSDSDQVGKRIRAILGEEFPDAIHLHTKAEYRGVENTPLEYLQQLLLKHELLRTDCV